MEGVVRANQEFLARVRYYGHPRAHKIHPLSLHDALPIYYSQEQERRDRLNEAVQHSQLAVDLATERSEEHTSELQSRVDLVCRLLLEKKNAWPLEEPHARACGSNRWRVAAIRPPRRGVGS